jgi:3-isopropylmalate/(R)-2-methylmalate dehydratase small subunit
VADYGFRALIAPNYADIFYSNCFKNGILPVILPEAHVEELFRRAESKEGYSLTIDLVAQTISDTNGLVYRFEIAEFQKHLLLEGLDDIGLTLKQDAKIAEYEKSHRAGATMYSPVDAKYATRK